MKVHQSENSKKIAYLCCALCLFFLLTVAGMELIKCRSYVPTRAVITDTFKELDLGISTDTRPTVLRYYTCSYSDGEQSYDSTYQTFFALFRRVGMRTGVRYDPKNPSNTMNKFLMECCMCGILLFGTVLTLGLWQDRKMRTSRH